MLSNPTQQILLAGLEEAAAALLLPAVHLAALTPLPPSPMLLQEVHDQVFAVSIALGTSPPPLIISQPTRCVTLISWAHSIEVSMTTVQHLPGWAQTWPMIRLADLANYYHQWQFIPYAPPCS
ncbi:hypothetical protein B0H14DRAFT_3469230 [Mycena olivaceomarginata]|nr:hypothetical protein B0H14DRAFT_3469230 [Mycena olivaceomarginata]